MNVESANELRLAYVLREVSLRGPDRPLLEGFNEAIRDHAITVIIGPENSGQSEFLRALSGLAPQLGWHQSGSWLHRGRSAVVRGSYGGFRDVAWFPRRPGQSDAEPWQSALGSTRTILLDRPDMDLTDGRCTALVEKLIEHRRHGAAVVVPQSLSFARQVADDVIVLHAATAAASVPVYRSEFAVPVRFERPDPGTVATDAAFHWVIPGRLGLVNSPGGRAPTPELARSLTDVGISQVLSLEPQLRLGPGLAVPAATHHHVNERDVRDAGDTLARVIGALAEAIKGGARVVIGSSVDQGVTIAALAALLSALGGRSTDLVTRAQAWFDQRTDSHPPSMQPGKSVGQP